MKFLSKLLIYFTLLMMVAQPALAAFTPNKAYNNQTTGTNSNTWGVVLNGNFTTIDNNLGGTESLSVSGSSNVTLTSTEAQNLFYDFTGTLTGDIIVYFPAAGGFYYVNNGTTGAYTLTIEATGDSVGVVIPQGASLPVYVDNSTSPPTVTTASFVAPGANSTITSLTGLTTPLSIAQGGTTIFSGGTTGGSANAQTLATVSPTSYANTAGYIVTGIAGYTNTSTATLAVNSQTAKAVDVETPAGLAALSGGEIYTGNSYVFYYDGTEFILINPSVIPYINTANTWTASQAVTATSLTISTATFTPTFATSNNFKIALINADCPCTVANPSGTIVPGTNILLEIKQSSTGSDTIGTWGTYYKFPGGTAPTLSTTASHTDLIPCYVSDATHLFCSSVLNFAQ